VRRNDAGRAYANTTVAIGAAGSHAACMDCTQNVSRNRLRSAIAVAIRIRGVLRQEERSRHMEASEQGTRISLSKHMKWVDPPVYPLGSSCRFNYTTLATGQVALWRQINYCDHLGLDRLSRTCEVSFSRNYSRSTQAACMLLSG
jgi:hypothetical protein